MSFLPVCRGLCKAWRKKIPERSEDDFLSPTQPLQGAALRNHPGKRLSLQQEMKKRTSAFQF
ncbi:hypothetical protein [Parabacteroides distasonis]|uniref:hypothetical protein n=1 Tax=Parabacteroides distasonis TaxID=823 RepID=UPI0032C06D89